MKSKMPATDYRQLRLSNIRTPEYRHVFLLLFWPLFLIVFQAAEHLIPAESCHPVYTPLDDHIPFCEWFLIPYLFWFAYIAGMVLYTLLYDVDSFRRLMRFFIITYTAAVVIYFLYPTCQNLRPAEFARDNALTRFMAAFYRFDTNTNVCPSIHVLGSAAVWAAGWNAPALQKKRWKWGFSVISVSICLSTVFLKQHSVIDILAALPLCLAGYRLCYRRNVPEEQEKIPVREGS